MNETTFKTSYIYEQGYHNPKPDKLTADNGRTQMTIYFGLIKENELGINILEMGTIDTTDAYLFSELITEAIRLASIYNINK